MIFSLKYSKTKFSKNHVELKYMNFTKIIINEYLMLGKLRWCSTY